MSAWYPYKRNTKTKIHKKGLILWYQGSFALLQYCLPDKQGSCWAPIDRTACQPLPISRCPTVTHRFHGSGWYSRIWQVKSFTKIIFQIRMILIHNTRSLMGLLNFWPCPFGTQPCVPHMTVTQGGRWKYLPLLQDLWEKIPLSR